MPPISNAINVACAIIGIPTDAVLQISYVTVGIAFILTSLFVCKVYIGRKYKMPQHLIPTEKASAILKREWKNLIPLMVLIVLVALNSIPSISFDATGELLKAIPLGESSLYDSLKAIPVIGQLTNNIVLALLVAINRAIAITPALRVNLGPDLAKSMKTIRVSVLIQVFAGFFLGAFRVGGQIAAISEWATGLNTLALKLGGAGSLILGGMLLGAQSTTQTSLLPILGPAWIATGVTDVHAAAASAHLAAAGQGLPPADLNTFVIAGLVSSLLGKQVNPMKSMLLTVPYCLLLAFFGLVFLFV